MHVSSYQQRPVYIIEGARTPFLKAKGKRGEFSASDLAVQAGRQLLLRQPFSPTALDEVVIGTILPSENEANIARIISLRLGCGKNVPAWTVQHNCGSGLQAIDSAAKDITLGRSHLALAGGTEAMSRAPLLYNHDMEDWVGSLYKCRAPLQKLRIISRFKPHFLKPIVALVQGLADPIAGLSMGQTAEILAYRFGITKLQMDKFSVLSHQRLAAAQAKLPPLKNLKEGDSSTLKLPSEKDRLTEIISLYSPTGRVYSEDDGVRLDTNLESLEKLSPFFDKKFGLVTAGNSSQITDGAAVVLLASEEAVHQYNLPVLGRIVDSEWAGLEPENMGLGPIFAATPILQRHKFGLSDIDFWEINEAFAAQVLACLAAWKDEKFCQESLGLPHALGSLNQNCLNVDGGAIALGHPIGASGARILLHLLHTLKHQGAKRGIASICIGGGQGGAMLVETV